MRPGPKPRPPEEALLRLRTARRRARRRQADREKAIRRAAHPEKARFRANEKGPTSSAPHWIFVQAGLTMRARLYDNNLRYINHAGQVHREDTRSAEQLMADYQKSRNHPIRTGHSQKAHR